MSDKELQKSVMAELEFEPSIDASNIGVTAERGVVTLTGHVASYPQRTSAERAAWRVKGVKALADEIEVRLPWERKLKDDQIAKRALDVIAWNIAVPANAIRVQVTNGLVKLSGKVEWNYQRAAAEAAVRKLSGVVGLNNEITLATQPQPADLKQRITDALKRHAEIEAGRIKLDVHDGTVEIDGEVDDWEERQAVERAVWSAPGVNAVRDHLTIR